VVRIFTELGVAPVVCPVFEGTAVIHSCARLLEFEFFLKRGKKKNLNEIPSEQQQKKMFRTVSRSLRFTRSLATSTRTATSSFLPKAVLVGAGLGLAAVTMATFADANSIPRHGIPGTVHERTL
jgi:hypothetical protein